MERFGLSSRSPQAPLRSVILFARRTGSYSSRVSRDIGRQDNPRAIHLGDVQERLAVVVVAIPAVDPQTLRPAAPRVCPSPRCRRGRATCRGASFLRDSADMLLRSAFAVRPRFLVGLGSGGRNGGGKRTWARHRATRPERHQLVERHDSSLEVVARLAGDAQHDDPVRERPDDDGGRVAHEDGRQAEIVWGHAQIDLETWP